MKIQSFSRYEFKYILTNQLAERIESEVSYFMKYDGYVDPKMGNRYIVRSLYFENDSFVNFNEKVDGIKKRKKYRLRTYSRTKSKDSSFFLEEKGRVNERTYKNRTSLRHSDLVDIFSIQNHIKDFLIRYPDNDVINGFIFDTIRKSLKPMVLIDYKRRPYINNNGLLFRATFDSDIKSCLSNSLYPEIHNKSWKECRAGYTVLEIKFERSMPPWFHRIIQCYNLRRISISKMVVGMESCSLVEDV
jgi:SPX domain protein involved in polyphosphate accumulation